MCKNKLPWWAKIGAKILLSRLPFPYQRWSKLGLFKHGKMMEKDYAYGVFQNHVAWAGLSDSLDGKTILELGPGDSVMTAFFAYESRARAILVDSGDYAETNPEAYLQITNRAFSQKTKDPLIFQTRDEFLRLCGGQYFTKGLWSLKEIQTNSIDLVFSQAVLEHVKKMEFEALINETFRVLRPGGKASHVIDLKDHLGGSLNNLRFSEKLWESEFFSRSGFYTNRLRLPEIKTIIEKTGFVLLQLDLTNYDHLPLPRKKMAPYFQRFSEFDLKVSGCRILLVKQAPQRV